MFNAFKKIKFEKSGLPIIPVCLFFIVFLSLFGILRNIKLNSHYFNIRGFGYPIESIKINFEARDRLVSEQAFLVCYNDYCATPDTDLLRNYYFSDLTPQKIEFFEQRINKLYLASNPLIKDFPENLTTIDINVGNKNIYLNHDDIQKLKRKEIKISYKDKKGNVIEDKYNALILPEVNNYRGIVSQIKNIFLSLFYNWQIFIVSYFWLFMAFLVYVFNKDEFKFIPDIKLNKKVYFFAIGGILLIGVCLRFIDISYFPLWTDEVYTKQVALDSFLNCFKDPGNPPLFFCLEYIFTKIFSDSVFALRFLPAIFGILFVFYTYLLFYDVFKTKENEFPVFPLFASFLASINVINIYHSQEARGYSLCMLLVTVSIYYLFRYLKNPENKNLLLTGIVNILLVNCNYYLILFSITNYIWGFVDLIQNKNLENKKKEILKFTASYFVAFLTTLPFFVISSKAVLSNGFNAWIPKLSSDLFYYTVKEYFINKYIFIALCFVLLVNLLLCYIPKKYLEKINIKINKNKEDLFLYLIYTFTLILIIACLISLFIKPIFHKRVLISIYSLLFLTEVISIASVIETIKENKFLKAIKSFYVLILLLICFTITKPMPMKEVCNLSAFMNFVQNDIKQYDDSYEIYLINADTKDYLKEYPEIYNNKKINFYFIDTNSSNIIVSIKKRHNKIKLKYTNLNTGLILTDGVSREDDEKKIINTTDDEIEVSENKNIVIYFNAIGVDIDAFADFNPAIRIYKNNLVTSGKLVYEL